MKAQISMKPFIFLLSFFGLVFSAFGAENGKLSALIVDGRNNHDWQTTTDALRAILESTGRFEVTVSTAPELKIPRGPRKPNSDDAAVQAEFEEFRKSYNALTKPVKNAFPEKWTPWNPNFTNYDVVILNYNGPDWPKEMRTAFVDYVKNGGGVLAVHAANNAFGNWQEFNEIIGLGWRPAIFGKCPKVNPETGEVFYVEGPDKKSGHGSKHAFQVTVRKPEHPIMRGLPPVWMHGRDELYHHMRGPAKNLTILSSAFSDPKERGTGQHEPITWEVGYGKGRVIVTSMGHFWPGDTTLEGLHCVGFQTIIARSCEYVATGEVTQWNLRTPLPTSDEISSVNPSATDPAIVKMMLQRTSKPIASPNIGTLGKLYKSAHDKKSTGPYAMLTPEEERATFDLAPGYRADLAAAEPDVQEPVLTVWDGNGAMYVAEMRSYMQDEKGTGTKSLKNGRVKRLEDKDGDGLYETVTIFVDNLNLPRAILPLDDRIAIRESDTLDVFSYRDTTGDGVADEKKLLYEGGTDGRHNPEKSVEHQDSGLMWNLDNNIYITYNSERYRFTDGTWTPEKQRGHWTQWGLTSNDVGDIFWSTNTDPVAEPYIHPRYLETANRRAGKGINGKPIDLGAPYDVDFMQVKSLCLLDDRGGAAAETRAFTSACGQSVFRGHKLPFEDYGRYFVCDPTIHVVRRANLFKKDGLDRLEKTEPDEDEFLRSSDINSRFINTATGPDGCLYVTDMYRGIIQDAGWLSPGPRENIVKNGLHDNNQHGRIWRIRHADHTPGQRPRMLDESTVELLRHLEHPNGWWRDTAQKLIILREDRETVVPMLRGMARFAQNPLTRLHALWTLEGMGAAAPEQHFTDRDPRVRRAAVQIAEHSFNILDFGDFDLRKLTPLASDPDPRVAEQVIHSLGTNVISERDEIVNELVITAAKKYPADKGVMLATGISLWGKKDLPFVKAIFKGKSDLDPTVAATWKAALSNWNRGLKFSDDMPKDDQRFIQNGETLYFKSCVTCHGGDGKGIKIAGTDIALAPSLADSKRVHGDPEKLIPIALHGLIGPIDGKAYQAGFMPSFAALGIPREDRSAEILSYIRYAWGAEIREIITKEQIVAAKKKHADRATPWTDAELND